MKNWNRENLPCRLRKTYIRELGYIKLSSESLSVCNIFFLFLMQLKDLKKRSKFSRLHKQKQKIHCILYIFYIYYINIRRF